MRLPNSVHEAHPWVISRIAPDFALLDAWALPAEGGPDDFAALVEVMTSLDPAEASSISKVLFAVRRQLGNLFGWDDVQSPPIPGCTETTLSARLPDELRGSAQATSTGDATKSTVTAFVPLYRTDDEWAAEIGNETVHGVLQVAWVEQDAGRYRGQLGIYVKPRGRKGALYLRLIAPFRHLFVYPALMRQIDRAWRAR